MQPVNKDKFFFLYQNEFGNQKPQQHAGLANLLDFFESDDEITDIRHAAYMLATVKRECADTWRPIEEYGKGKGREYGTPADNGKVFYGRGYVQLTWAGNYKEMGRRLGVDLYNHPELACQPDIAYKIMSYGMHHGSFTGVGLSKYINETKCDYINARRIINGTDVAEMIAGYAEKLEHMLRESAA